MASFVEIANMAGAYIGTSSRITDPNDDRTLARAIRAAWDIQRRAAIRDGSWNFAAARARLAASNVAPAFGFAYQYQVPPGFIRLVEIVHPTGYREYRFEGGKILCDVVGPLDILYFQDVVEPEQWSDGFADAFAARIAWSIGRKIAGSTYDKEAGWQTYQDALNSAKRTDALENPPIEREESDWVTARHASAFWQPDA